MAKLSKHHGIEMFQTKDEALLKIMNKFQELMEISRDIEYDCKLKSNFSSLFRYNREIKKILNFKAYDHCLI